LTIRLTNSVIDSSVPAGTTIGTLSCSITTPVQYGILLNGGLPVGISGNNLLAMWFGRIPDRVYPLLLYAGGPNFSFDFGFLQISVISARVGLDLLNITTQPQNTPSRPGP
jgi:hypothetical protein